MSSSINPDTRFSQGIHNVAKAQNNNVNNPVEQKVSEFTHDKKPEKVQDSISVSQKKQLNAAIIEASLKFSHSISDKPLALVLKTALQGINEALKVDDIDSSVEDAYAMGVDFSPEATAERIVAFSTQFFSAFQEQHPEIRGEDSLTSFINVIKGGIEQGFDEAKTILEGVKVLTGSIAENIEKTYELVQQGLQFFLDSFSEKKAGQGEL